MRNGRRAVRKNAKVNYMPFIIMLCLSVACGYGAAKYVVQPVVNYVPQLTAEKHSEDTDEKEPGSNKDTQKKDVIEDDISVKDGGNIDGYALQFGCYSDEASAQKAMEELGIEDLRIVKQNDMYKIVGKTYPKKSEARKALEEKTTDAKAFVTPLYSQQ